MADNANMVVISVGYRLAPEHPFPKGPEDCYDVADYLVKNGRTKYGGDLAFIGGEVCRALWLSIYIFSNIFCPAAPR